MTFLSLLSVFFLFLLIRNFVGPNITGNRFDAYFYVVLTLMLVSGYPPLQHALFQRELTQASAQLLKNENVFVNCNSTFDSIYHLGMAGFVYRGSDEINLEVRTCSDLKDYLQAPASANTEQLYALHVLTHEAMHVAGEFNETLTDCKAFQRNHRMAKLLGVADVVAEQNAIDIHRNRSRRHPYYSEQCEPGTHMDEKLADAVWGRPKL